MHHGLAISYYKNQKKKNCASHIVTTLIVFFFYISISLEALIKSHTNPKHPIIHIQYLTLVCPTFLIAHRKGQNMALRALVTLLFVPLFLSPTILGYSQADIKKWCSQTPNPEPCEYFLSHNPNYHNPIKQKSHFFTISKQLALERV